MTTKPLEGAMCTTRRRILLCVEVENCSVRVTPTKKSLHTQSRTIKCHWKPSSRGSHHPRSSHETTHRVVVVVTSRPTNPRVEMRKLFSFVLHFLWRWQWRRVSSIISLCAIEMWKWKLHLELSSDKTAEDPFPPFIQSHTTNPNSPLRFHIYSLIKSLTELFTWAWL